LTDYFKGDSAFLFVPSAAESNRLNAAAERHITADEMQKFISLGAAWLKCIDYVYLSYLLYHLPCSSVVSRSTALSQKGDLVDSLVLQRVYAGSQAAGAQPYTMADFTYVLTISSGAQHDGILILCPILRQISVEHGSGVPDRALRRGRRHSRL
jgi:hypothetical protein